MKIRHPLVLKALGCAGAWAVRGWVGTLRYRYVPLGDDVTPWSVRTGQRFLYAFWHENMLLPVYQFSRHDVAVLVSQHADGQLIAEICRHFRLRTVRGSTTRGGVEAVRQMLKSGRKTHLVITPDGPRGPRRRVQSGLVYLAARTGLPVVPTGVGYENPWRLRSWDRFALPRPWTRGVCVTGEPIFIPPHAGRGELEAYRVQVEQALLAATELAERVAATGVVPAQLRPRASA